LSLQTIVEVAKRTATTIVSFETTRFTYSEFRAAAMQLKFRGSSGLLRATHSAFRSQGAQAVNSVTNIPLPLTPMPDQAQQRVDKVNSQNQVLNARSRFHDKSSAESGTQGSIDRGVVSEESSSSASSTGNTSKQASTHSIA
jgi:hypothetical protein